MNKPEVRIIQNQEEIVGDSNIDNWEVEQLLRKYGYMNTENDNSKQEQINNNLTFEEMILQQESKNKAEKIRLDSLNKSNDYSRTVYQTDEESGFSFRIEVVSDMQIPK